MFTKLRIKSNCPDYCGVWTKKIVTAEMLSFAPEGAVDKFNETDWLAWVIDHNFANEVHRISDHLFSTMLDEDVSELKFKLNHYDVHMIKV